MQRLALFFVLCLFALLLCSVAANLPQKSPLLPEKAEVPPAHAGEKDNPLIEKREFFRKNPGLFFHAAGKRPDSDAAFPEIKEIENETAAPVEEAPAPENPPRKQERPLKQLPGEDKNSIHFLLTGRWWEDEAAEVIMMVTLVPEKCARIAALDPETGVQLEEKTCPIGELLKRGGSRDQLFLAVNSLTGLTPRFYIDLNLHGFVEMVNLLAKEGPGGVSPDSRAASQSKSRFEGKELLQLLNDASISTAAKEKSLIELLLAACEIQFTPLGLKLLWMGYHNLKTDLSLRDLLEVRKVTQGIAPTDVIFTEIAP